MGTDFASNIEGDSIPGVRIELQKARRSSKFQTCILKGNAAVHLVSKQLCPSMFWGAVVRVLI